MAVLKGAKLAAKFIKDVTKRAGKAKQWFRDTVKAAQKIAMPGAFGRKEYMSDDGNIGVSSSPEIGRFYLYQYDPKWKDILPWYDIWPLVFPFDYAKGGFYGINVHYLPPNARADLMVSLLSAHGEGAMLNKRFKMKLSYNIITQFKPARACIKRYLYNHVQGKGFYTIPADDWTYAAALPMQKFKKASNSEVWSHSKTLY